MKGKKLLSIGEMPEDDAVYGLQKLLNQVGSPVRRRVGAHITNFESGDATAVEKPAGQYTKECRECT